MTDEQEDARLERRVVTLQDVQDILTECGHRGEAFDIEYVNRMGLRIALDPRELLALVQMFLDAEQTRALLRGTVAGWKARTAEKLSAPRAQTPQEDD